MRSVYAGMRGADVSQTLSVGALFLLFLLAACQTVPLSGESAVLAQPVNKKVAVPSNAPRFLVDPKASEVRLLVYRAGALAHFGHNHVITGRVRGEIRVGERAAASGFHLEIPIGSFIVDPPTARAEEGNEFSADVSQQAREATRNNMLGKNVLDAASRPLIEIESVALTGPRWNPTVIARTTLHGVTRDLRFSAAVIQQDDSLTVVASFPVRQSDFGIEPYTAFGGGLQVRDAIDIRMHVVARREK